MTVDWINFVDLMMLLSSTMNRSIIILFTCLGWIAFYLLRELAEVIARTRQNIVLSADFNVETELKRWRSGQTVTADEQLNLAEIAMEESVTAPAPVFINQII